MSGELYLYFEGKSLSFVTGVPWQRRESCLEAVVDTDWSDTGAPTEWIEKKMDKGFVCPVYLRIDDDEIFAFDVDTSHPSEPEPRTSVKLQAEIIATALNNLLVERGWQKMGLEFLVPELERHVPCDLPDDDIENITEQAA
jgi:hypothetical protein